MTTRIAFLAALSLVTTSNPQAALAEPPPSYARQVKPFLARYCLECHNAEKMKGGLNLESHKSLLQGGENGAVLEPGQADQSKLVMQVEGKSKPKMPPQKARQPKPEEVGILRAWVAAGAKDDSADIKVVIPDIKPRTGTKAAIAALAYSPDGKRLAAGGYKEVTLLDVATGDIAGKLAGQAGAVTALAFSHDGKTLAVASGVPGASGEIRLYTVPPSGIPAEKPTHTITEHKDLLYALAWSPDDKLLASAGYDRIIRLWNANEGKEVRSLKDHSDTIYGLAFSKDGKLLASASADRAVKLWDVASGRRLYTLGESTDWLYALAWSPDGQHLAGAGVDQSIRVWAVGPTSGKLIHSVYAHEAPVSKLAYGADGKTLYSLGEDRALKSWDTATMLERKVYSRQPETPLALAVRPDQKQLAVGRYDGAVVLIEEATGKVEREPLPAKPGAFPVVPEQEPNDSPNTAQKITLPATVVGTLGKAGDVDYFRFDAKLRQQIGVQALPDGPASKLEPVLQLLDASSRVLVESESGVLGFTCPTAGSYIVGIRDRDYRGGAEMKYRLRVGNLPVVTVVYPLGLQRGTEAMIHLRGVNIGEKGSDPSTEPLRTDSREIRIKAAADAAIGTQLPVTVTVAEGPVLGNPKVVIGEFTEVVSAKGFDSDPQGTKIRAKDWTMYPTLPVPGTANGYIAAPGDTDTWSFSAKKGQRLVLEVHARRLGTPLDSYIEILDSQGKPLPRATLRCLAKTYVTFRDHDSAGSGIRIETWNDFAMNDYMLVGDELLKIRELPKNPDDDCQFFSVSGQRVGQLDTTPTHHSLGTPMYKVSIHPPGSTFPPNGLPVHTLYFRNDDGGPGYGKDSRLVFDPPADATYQVRIGDAHNQGGPNYIYRLTVRPPRPSYTISFNPTNPSVWKGNAIPITVSATRTDGYEGAIDLRLENLPPGFSAPASKIGAGDNSTAFALWADPTAASPKTGMPLKIVARAKVDGQEVTREAIGELPKAVDPGDLVTSTEQAEVTVKPGSEVRLTVKIERRNGFTGRVPLDVRGLPHGVRVLDIGLNGILVIPTETSRTVAIYCEPWVQEQEHPFVVLSKREGKNTEYAAKSVLLRVKK